MDNSDKRTIVPHIVDDLDVRRVTSSLNGVILSNRFEVLGQNSDVNSDTESVLCATNQLVDSYDLQRSVCSDDSKIQPKSKYNARKPVVGEILQRKKLLEASVASLTDQDLTNDIVMASVDATDPDPYLDTMDSAITGSHTSLVDTMGLLPIWCTEFEKCKQPIDLGFIPLIPIITYSGPDIQWNEIQDVIEAHTLIRDSGQLNFLGKRIPVQNNLKVDNWWKYMYLVNYFDQQLPDLIEFGFPLSFDRNLDLISTSQNHPSAVQFIDHVDKYITEELSYQAIIGPFDEMPFKMHIPPFMTRKKADSDTRRTIIDMSWPKGASVSDRVLKDSYLRTNFQIHYPSVNTIIQQVITTGPAARIFKVDIS